MGRLETFPGLVLTTYKMIKHLTVGLWQFVVYVSHTASWERYRESLFTRCSLMGDVYLITGSEIYAYQQSLGMLFFLTK